MQLGVSPSKATKYNNPVKPTHDYYKAEVPVKPTHDYYKAEVQASNFKNPNDSKAELIP
jgi:hypothetical protein